MTGPITSLFTVAMREEADPLIDLLRLKKEADNNVQPIYSNENSALIISGIGKMKAAAATAHLFARVAVSDHAVVLNYGIAGAVDARVHQRSQLLLINQIVDQGSMREFYPDMLVDHGLQETRLTTFDTPVSYQSSCIPEAGLVDMEASGFYEAAALFVGPHRIGCVKIVSDHLEGKRLNRTQIRSMVAGHAETIQAMVGKLVLVQQNATLPMIPAEETAWIESLQARLRLTVSQTRMLTKWVRAYRLKTGRALPTPHPDLTSDIKTKTQRNQRLESIRQLLAP